MENTSTRRGFTQQGSLLHLREKVAGGRMRGNLAAFTLIELVIAVLIIGILAAVAIPMYKHALIKSRFSTVMPVAKAIADAQESYYLRNGQYASSQEALDVTPPAVENTTIELSGAEEDADENYAYVVASRSDVPGAKYIQYQKNSPQFASNIHCEALTGDTRAEQLCVSLGGEYMGKNGDYSAYLLAGNKNNGSFDKECTGPQETEAMCPSGCGTGTREAECNTRTGEWRYGEEVSGCPEQPATSQECSANNKTGTQTRTVTCNSAGTAWETGAWSACNIPCEGEPPANVTASQSGATGTATCVNGQWVYEWTGGNTYGNSFASCEGATAYACAGATFSGTNSVCYGRASNACANSSFTEPGAHCYGNANYACANAIFSGQDTYCDGRYSNACAGSIISGEKSSCSGNGANGCAGTKILAGASCNSDVTNGCNGALYGAHPDKDPSLIGSCRGNNCPYGVPVSNFWNDTTKSYTISQWMGGYCNPNAMIGGVCPDGSPKQGGGWNGGYCNPTVNGTCPAGSPKKDGGTW